MEIIDEYIKVKCTKCKTETEVSLITKDVSCPTCRFRREILIRALLKEYSRWANGFSVELIKEQIEDQRLLQEISFDEKLMLHVILEKVDSIVKNNIIGGLE